MSAHGTMLATPSCEPTSHVFDLWAQVYDSQPNPLLALEEREAMSLLPSMEGCDVLDVGCGTGRWLSKLEAIGCTSLAGTDCSLAMLQAARAKVSSLVELRESECTDLPWGRSSKTLVLASFLLSYVDDVEMFAKECARVIRPGGWLLISDMHPVTARERNWKRSFCLDESKVEIRAKTWPLDEILSCFRHHGFEIETLIEPPFGRQ
jgi:ubiquinone/menaquinone biosynthesis C-methylase UbiE